VGGRRDEGTRGRGDGGTRGRRDEGMLTAAAGPRRSRARHCCLLLDASGRAGSHGWRVLPDVPLLVSLVANRGCEDTVAKLKQRRDLGRGEVLQLMPVPKRGSVRNFVCEAVHHTAGFVNRPS
jgi:hypothetical protein